MTVTPHRPTDGSAMCDVCCAELRRWSRAFTRAETFLSLLEAVLLIAFIAFLTFVVLHFLACSKKEIGSPQISPGGGSDTPGDGDVPGDGYIPEVDDQDQYTSTPGGKGSSNIGISTVAPGTTCSWKPGKKTEAVTRYFEQSGVTQGVTTPTEDFIQNETSKNIIDELLPYLSDGEVAETSYKQYVLALVKVRPPQDITFGCILTIVDEYWAVTAASCIEAIEEVDSLDSFVMMEDYGESTHGKTHTVADVLIHPWYEGKNKSYDLVALKSEDSLVKGSKTEVELPSALDYYLTTIGEKFTLLGYGGYRSVDQGPSGRRLRWVSSFALSPAQCGAGDGAATRDVWSPRHLSRPHAAPQASCGARVLCAGALSARGAACNYCAGAPLLLNAKLYGVMSDNPHCGVACEPVLFVNVPLLRPWVDAALTNDALKA